MARYTEYLNNINIICILHIEREKKNISKSLLIDLAEKYFIKSAKWQAHHWGAPCGDRW